MRSQEELEAWEGVVSRALRSADGAYQLCTRIFGTEATTYLIEKHQLGEGRAASYARAHRVAQVHGQEVVRRRRGDEEDDEDQPPSQRRRS